MEPVLERGIFKPKSEAGGNDEAKEYIIQKLEETYLHHVMALQEVITQRLHYRDILEPFSTRFMKAHFSEKGFVLGAFIDGELIAFRNVYFPDVLERKWHLGKDAGLLNRELASVANFQMVCVHPDYRGNSLASKMNNISLRLLYNLGTYEHICATVSPYNVWNLRILLNSGFSIINLKPKYGEKLRFIVHQRLTSPITFRGDHVKETSLVNFVSQKALLRQGYRGVSLIDQKASIRGGNIPVSTNYLNLLFKKPINER